MEAPLSSPTPNGSSRPHPSYFAPSTSTTASASSSYRTQSQTDAPSASNTQAQPHHQVQPQTQPQTQTHSQSQFHADQQSAEPFLRDFNLVAEAAKRAQMAVLMRDLEAVGI